MKDFKKDYGRYNSTVKTVQYACMAMNEGYYMSEGDINALAYAVADLSEIIAHFSEKKVEELRP